MELGSTKAPSWTVAVHSTDLQRKQLKTSAMTRFNS